MAFLLPKKGDRWESIFRILPYDENVAFFNMIISAAHSFNLLLSLLKLVLCFKKLSFTDVLPRYMTHANRILNPFLNVFVSVGN